MNYNFENNNSKKKGAEEKSIYCGPVPLLLKKIQRITSM